MVLTIHRHKVKRKRVALNLRDSGIKLLVVGTTMLITGARLRTAGVGMILAGASVLQRTNRIVATLEHPYAYRYMFQYARRNLDSFPDDLYPDKFRFPRDEMSKHINYLLQFWNFAPLIEVDYDVLVRGIVQRKQYKFPIDELYLMYLRYFAIPCRQNEVAEEFGRTIPEVSRGILWFHRHLAEVSKSFLQNELQDWFDYEEAAKCARAISAKGCLLNFCIGFVDGVHRRIANPSVPWLQRDNYSGYKRTCGLNYAGCSLPNGMCLLFLGPSPGRRHDATVAAEHELYEKLEHLASFPVQGFRGCFNGDSAYPLFWPIIPLYGNPVTNNQVAWNQSTSSHRVSVEWLFGQQVQKFSTIDWKIRNRVLASPVVESHINGAFLTNLLNTRFPNIISQKYNCKPPTLEKYLNVPDGSLD